MDLEVVLLLLFVRKKLLERNTVSLLTHGSFVFIERLLTVIIKSNSHYVLLVLKNITNTFLDSILGTL